MKTQNKDTKKTQNKDTKKTQNKDTKKTQNKPFAIEGYFPLYKTKKQANAASPNKSSHTHTFDNVDYYMPNGLPTFFHGGYPYLQK